MDRLGDLTEDEATAVGAAARRISRALEGVDDVLRVHLALIGLHVPHFHLHGFPRYTWLPRDVDMNALHTLDDAPRGGEAEIAAFAERRRARL